MMTSPTPTLHSLISGARHRVHTKRAVVPDAGPIHRVLQQPLQHGRRVGVDDAARLPHRGTPPFAPHLLIDVCCCVRGADAVLLLLFCGCDDLAPSCRFARCTRRCCFSPASRSSCPSRSSVRRADPQRCTTPTPAAAGGPTTVGKRGGKRRWTGRTRTAAA